MTKKNKYSGMNNLYNINWIINFNPIMPTAIYPAFSKFIYISSHFMNNPEVNRNAITPIIAPVITNRNWSLIATAAVILSIENAKSVMDNKRITLNNELIDLWLLSISLLVEECLFKAVNLETDSDIK